MSTKPTIYENSNTSELRSACQELVMIDVELKRIRQQRNVLQRRHQQIQQKVIQYLQSSHHDSITTPTHIFELKTVQRHKPMPKKDKHAILEKLVREKATPDHILKSIRQPLPVQTIVQIKSIK